MFKDEEIRGPGARDFGLASEVEWESSRALLVANSRISGTPGVFNNLCSRL
jgi:hypothetical protein